MKPEWCPQERAKIEAQYYADWLHAGNSTGSLSEHALAGLTDSFERALLDAHQRGKEENQAEIDRLNKVIARMQQTMSSQAEQWSRSMAEAKREGMEENQSLRQIISECAEASGAFVSPAATVEFMALLPKEIEAIRAKAQEVKT